MDLLTSPTHPVWFYNPPFFPLPWPFSLPWPGFWMYPEDGPFPWLVSPSSVPGRQSGVVWMGSEAGCPLPSLDVFSNIIYNVHVIKADLTLYIPPPCFLISYLSLCTYYSGWVSCLISFTNVYGICWAMRNRKQAKNSKWKYRSRQGIEPATPHFPLSNQVP